VEEDVNDGVETKGGHGGELARPFIPEVPTPTPVGSGEEEKDFSDIVNDALDQSDNFGEFITYVWQEVVGSNEQGELSTSTSTPQTLTPVETSTPMPQTSNEELIKMVKEIAKEMELDANVMLEELGFVDQIDPTGTQTPAPTPTPTPTPQPTPTPTLTAEEQKQADIDAEYETMVMPEEGPYIPENHILDYSGFGEGYSEWSEGEIEENQLGYYILRGKEGDPIEERLPLAAQYMSPRRITNNKGLMNNTHSNLCGQLAVIAALGLDLADGLNLFAEIEIDSTDQELYKRDDTGEKKKKKKEKPWAPEKGIEILNNGSVGTTYLTLENFINHATGGKYTCTKRSSNNNQEEFGSVDYLEESLQNGNKIIALVNIDKNDEGGLNAKDDTSDPTAHWIEVQDVYTTKDGETYVRVYNPYMNREEVYDEDTFMDAWEKTGDTKEKNNFNQHLIIEISEKGE